MRALKDKSNNNPKTKDLNTISLCMQSCLDVGLWASPRRNEWNKIFLISTRQGHWKVVHAEDMSPFWFDHTSKILNSSFTHVRMISVHICCNYHSMSDIQVQMVHMATICLCRCCLIGWLLVVPIFEVKDLFCMRVWRPIQNYWHQS